MELSCFGWVGGTGGGGGGGISGGGTVNYVAMFTPSGTEIGDAPIKIGDNFTRALPQNTGTNSIAMGYDILMSGLDNTLIGYELVDGGGTEVYALGSRMKVTGNDPTINSVFGLINIGFYNFFNVDLATTGIYAVYNIGDSNVFNQFVTFSTVIGEGQNLTRIDHCTSIGIFNDLKDATYNYIFGEANTLNLVTLVSSFGSSNNITESTSIVNVGNANSISSISDAVVIGLNNANALSNEILIAQNDFGIRIDVDGNVGIGVPYTPIGFNSINAKLHVSGVNVNSINQRLEPVLGVYEDTTGATIQTTDDIATPLETIPIPIDTIVMIESYITCRKTAGGGLGTIGEGNGYIRTVKAQNIGGVVTIGTIQSSFTSDAIPSFNATFAVSGTNILINVNGDLNDDVTWNSITKKYRVG
jgi:hypothetical protein